ncbi:uncharacterized mitochondrial protein-like protein [Tanacetum coccineum]
MNVSLIPTTRIHKDHPKDQIIGDINSATQTRRMTKIFEEHAMGWTLVDLPKGKRAIGTKWVYRNKKDKRGIIVRNKERLMDVKSAFLYGTIEEEVYVCQPPGFEYSQFPNKVYKVEKALYGLHQAPRSWYETLSTYLLENGYRRGTIDKTLFIKKDRDDAQEIPDEFYGGAHFLLRIAASTPIETNKALNKDEEAGDVDVHLYRSMIGSFMYLTASRPDLIFVVCACARFQVTAKTSHLYAVKRIFRYLKGQLKLGHWYPRDSPFDLKAFSDSDYAGASLDRKSTTGGCQFLGKRLLSWQCKKQTIVANSTTEAEYVATTNCCGQNPVFHSKTKHIEIRHHFIRDSYEKKFIQVIKIHTDHNVLDLLTKAFDTHKPRKAKRTTKKSQSSGAIHLVADETIYKEWEDRIEKAATTASSLEAEQDSGHAPIEPTTEETTPKEHVSTPSYDPPPSGEDRMQLAELMSLCTNLQEKVLDLEKAKTAQTKEIAGLKKRVKQLENRRKLRTSRLKRLRKVGSSSRVESSNDASLGAQEDASKQGRKIEDLDADT